MYVPEALSSTFNTHEQFRDFLANGTPLPGSGGGESAGLQGPSGNAVTAAGGAPASQTPQAGDAGPTDRYFDPSAGGLEQGLLAPVAQQTATQRQDLYQLGEDFRKASPAPMGMDQLGGLVGDVLTPGSLPDQKERLKGVMAGQYGGPAGLNQEKLAGVQTNLQGIGTQARALGEGSGLQSIIQSGVLGLTPGEAAFEAKRVLGNEDFRRQAATLPGQVAAVGAEAGALSQEAQGLAQQGQEAARALAGQAREKLGSARSGVYSELDKRVSEEEKKRKQLEAIYASGDLSGYLPETTTGARTEAAKAAEAAVMAGFPDVADISPLEHRITRTGRENLAGPSGQGGLAGQTTKAEEEALRDRQRQLDYYFSPGSPGNKNPAQVGFLGNAKIAAGQGGGGIYADIAPSYFGDSPTGAPDYLDLNAQDYVKYDAGISPTRENLATDDQRYIIDTVNELLDSLGPMAQEEPYRAATIEAEVDKFLAAEEAALNELGDKVSENQASWKKEVQKARRRYRQRHDVLAKITKPFSAAGNTVKNVWGSTYGKAAGGGKK